MIVDKIRLRIFEALRGSGYEEFAPARAEDILIETPRSRDFGHYSTNLPFLLKKDAKRPPMEIAEKLAGLIKPDDLFESVTAAKPGFINFKVLAPALQGEVARIRELDREFGKSAAGAGKRVQVEFVSANPTGPLSVGHGRLAAFGDALSTILSAAGFEVQKEFYVNDVGNQINRLAGSVEKRIRQSLGQAAEMAEDDYLGEYLVETSALILEKHGEAVLELGEDERRAIFAEDTIQIMLEKQQEALGAFGVKFDNWLREHTLHEAGALERAMDDLKAAGAVYENEGAVWFASTKYSDNEDRVLKKASGLHTYFMADAAYIRDKFERGFDTVIYIWGADHHGYIERMKSAGAALGYDPGRLEILIVQLVRFKQGEEFVRMSKRKGNIVTLSDLVDEIGSDVARFFFLMRTRESHLEFDLQLASDKSEANPLYYLQYAHARVCSILRKAAGSGLLPDNSSVGRLTEVDELFLIKAIADFPWEVQCAAVSREPHRLITYLTGLAGEFHAFYHNHRVIQEQDKELSTARLALCDSVRIVFRNTLALLGLSAPEEM